MEFFSGIVRSVVIFNILFVMYGIDSVSVFVDGEFRIDKAVQSENREAAINVANSTITHNVRRVKRQSSGKFEEAAEMGTLKLARVIVQMIRNLWVKNTVGGTCPWHESVPKPVVLLFKDRIGQMLAPPKSKNELEEEGR